MNKEKIEILNYLLYKELMSKNSLVYKEDLREILEKLNYDLGEPEELYYEQRE